MKSVQSKVLTCVFAGIVLLVATSLFATQQMKAAFESSESLLIGMKDLEKQADLANLTFKRQVQEWKNVLLRGHDPAKMDKYWAGFQAQAQQTDAFVTQLEQGLSEYPQLQAIATQFLIDHAAMSQAYTRGRDAFIASGFDHKVGDAAVAGIDRAPSAELEELGQGLAEITNTLAQRNLAQAERTALVALLSSLTVGLLVLFASTAVLRRFVLRPLNQLTAAVDSIAQGDYSQPIKIDSEDELGALSLRVESLRVSLGDLVTDLLNNSRALQSSVEALDTMSSSIAENTHHQTDLSHQIATAIEEMEAASREVAAHATETAGFTADTDKLVVTGSGAMKQAQVTMNDLVSDIEHTSEKIHDLAAQAKNVGSVLQVIHGIADQTNLLALNAAIEAARAGDHGRGFAVVADEVRSLAQKTQASTVEIDAILASIEASAEGAVAAMTTSRGRTQNTSEKITDAEAKLAQIARSVDGINEKNQHIATAAEEQTTVASSIAQSIIEVRDRSEETATQSGRAKTTSANLAALTHELQANVARLTQAAV